MSKDTVVPRDLSVGDTIQITYTEKEADASSEIKCFNGTVIERDGKRRFLVRELDTNYYQLTLRKDSVFSFRYDIIENPSEYLGWKTEIQENSSLLNRHNVIGTVIKVSFLSD